MCSQWLMQRVCILCIFVFSCSSLTWLLHTSAHSLYSCSDAQTEETRTWPQSDYCSCTDTYYIVYVSSPLPTDCDLPLITTLRSTTPYYSTMYLDVLYKLKLLLCLQCLWHRKAIPAGLKHAASKSLCLVHRASALASWPTAAKKCISMVGH